MVLFIYNSMEIKSIKAAKKNSDGTYNLYVNVLNQNNLVLIPFTCEKRHVMRIDLVCFDIYERVDFIDVICNINGLMNVFDIKEGDILYYAEEDYINDITSDETIMQNIRDTISKANKSKDFKLDKNRMNDVGQRRVTEKNKTYLPPNILPPNASNQTFENGRITFKPNF